MTFVRTMHGLCKVVGVGCILCGIYLTYHIDDVMSHDDMVHLPSLAFVTLALAGILLCSHQIDNIVGAIHTLIFASPTKCSTQINALNGKLEELSTVYYSAGIQGFKKQLAAMDAPPVWNAVINQIAAKIPKKDIRALLFRETQRYEADLRNKIAMLGMLASAAPSVGVLGTVLGLIRLLAELDNVKSLGPNMSLALVTTLYGLFYSVVVFKPLAERLATIKEVNLRTFEQAIFWVELVDHGKPAFYCDPKYQHSQKPKKIRRKEKDRSEKNANISTQPA